jgi:hypothetical protein
VALHAAHAVFARERRDCPRSARHDTNQRQHSDSDGAGPGTSWHLQKVAKWLIVSAARATLT